MKWFFCLALSIFAIVMAITGEVDEIFTLIVIAFNGIFWSLDDINERLKEKK